MVRIESLIRRYSRSFIMYVCVCNRVTQKDVEAAFDSGASSLRDLQKELKLGTNCGSCLPHAASVLKAAKEAAGNPKLFYAA